MMDYSYDPRKKSEQYRLKIRRGQLDSFFAQQRECLLEQQKEVNCSELVATLKISIEEQKEFLNRCSLSLTG
jgi:hypothetical protein